VKIAFFGSSLLSAYWNGAATYYRGIIRALHALGHTVTFYEPDAFDRQEHRDIAPPEWARSVVYKATEPEVLRHVEMARDADLIVKASGVGAYDELLEQAVLELSTPRNYIVFWDVDAPATLERVTSDPGDPFRELVPRYDAIFTYGGGDPVVNAYTELGARICVPIYNALDPAIHHPVPAEERFGSDLAFLGNRLPDRESRVHEFFGTAARRLPERTFLLGGNGWDDVVMPAHVRKLGHVFTADHNALNCSARMVLNISRESMARFGFSPATRVFEAAGAAACVITDAWDGISEFFDPDREILVARNGGDVARMIEEIPPRIAREIGRNALARALREHTYSQRAKQFEDVFEGALIG